MTVGSLADYSLLQISDLIRQRDVSVSAVTDAVLARTEQLAPHVRCFITVDAEAARREAARLDSLLNKQVNLGPLHGIPISVKDNLATAGIRTTAGSGILAKWVPDRNAAAVARLLAAGAIIFAKANMNEFAYGGARQEYGTPLNPTNQTRACGGSSSGSACAVGLGLGYASVGTDTGGSIRIPAALCGVVGLKPTFGLVSTEGVIPVSRELDHVGPIARTVPDVAAVLAALKGRAEGAFRWTAPAMAPADLRSLRIGYLELTDSDATHEVRSAIAAAYDLLRSGGALLSPISLPDPMDAGALMWTISAVEAADYHRPWLRSRARDYHPRVRSRLESAEFIPATAYVRAQRLRRQYSGDVDAVLSEVDAIALPAVPTTAPRIGDETVEIGGREEEIARIHSRFTALFNLSGHPAIVVPCGVPVGALPVGLQLVGRRMVESTILRIAAAYETMRDGRCDW